MSETADLRVVDQEPTEGIAATETVEADPPPPRRERSTIAFPYDDLDSAVSIAWAVHNTHGGQATMVQLAASLNQTTKSGAFRIKVSAGRLFGLVTVSQSTLALTERGNRVLDGVTEPQARAEAFLQVPLYAALYEQFKDGTLPDDNGLEAAIRHLGVTPKQVQTARQVFQRSAQQAGYFRFGNRKLVLPSVTTMVGQPDQPDQLATKADKSSGDRSHEGGSIVKHPFILGLLRELPDPEADFPADARTVWLDAAKISFDLIYGKVKPDDRGHGT